MVKDGSYGDPPRQLFRCVGEVVNERTGMVRPFHRFAPKLPRLMTTSGVCDTCDGPVHTHAGPVTGRAYGFPVREVAAAFVAVGNGASYTRAADRARVATRRRRLPGEVGGALVAEWLDLLGPVVLAPFAEATWPQTLVLDSTRFMAENRRTGTRTLAFNVLGAYGYPSDGTKPRVWGLQASHQATQADWEEFLRTLDVTTPPALVITDGEDAIGNAVRTVWPPAPSPSLPLPFVKRCEHHLHANGVEAMEADGIRGWAQFLRRRLDTAFRRQEGWDELAEKALGFPSTQHWLAGIADVELQVAVRHLLPQHHSTAALDQALGRVRDFLDSRSFVLRNKRRTNVMLGLIRAHLNGDDVERHYHAALRDHVDAHAGRLPAQRSGYDTAAGPRTDPGLRVIASLRA